MSPTSPRHPGAGAGRPRHAAFKVHRDSHGVHKRPASSPPPPPSSSSTNSSVSSSSTATAANNSHRKQQQQPVIIYTHSPKVIRTNPRDFMSIVQKLTGLDSPQLARTAGPAVAAVQDESSSSSSESCANAHVHSHPAGPPPYADSQLMPPPAARPPLDAHFVAPDIPLFAPGAPDQLQLCAPMGLYGQFPPVDAAALGPVMLTSMNSAAGSSGGGAMFSPSMVEAMRTFPDYN